MHFLTNWMDQYGYWILFFGLMAELIAFGIPTEVLMSYAGLLVFQGQLNWMMSILAAGMGSVIGMTISYGIGYKLGTPFFMKYGSRIHMGPERLKKTSEWFAGYLVFKGKLVYWITLIVACLGSISGVSFSFFLGHKWGLPLLEKHGRKIHITPERLEKSEIWFKRFGKFAVTFSYFIPGVRHFTAIRNFVHR